MGVRTVDVRVLAAMPLFEGLRNVALEQIVTTGRGQVRTPGSELVRQGDHADWVYLVLSGEALTVVDGHPVGPPVMAGECIGELAVLDDAPRAATVVSRTPMELLAFTAEEFHGLLAEHRILRDRLTRALTRRLRDVTAGWAQLAADADLLLDALVALQGDEKVRTEARAQAEALVRRLADSPASNGTDRDGPDPLAVLTPAQRRVALLVADGLSNVAVAEALHISRHTVETHLKSIYERLGVRSRLELATQVLRAGRDQLREI